MLKYTSEEQDQRVRGNSSQGEINDLEAEQGEKREKAKPQGHANAKDWNKPTTTRESTGRV